MAMRMRKTEPIEEESGEMRPPSSPPPYIPSTWSPTSIVFNGTIPNNTDVHTFIFTASPFQFPRLYHNPQTPTLAAVVDRDNDILLALVECRCYGDMQVQSMGSCLGADTIVFAVGAPSDFLFRLLRYRIEAWTFWRVVKGSQERI